MLKLPECTVVLEAHLTEEIKVVKHARDFALARAKADEEYAKKLFALNTKFGKIQVTEEYEESPIWKVWEQTWKSSDDYAAHLADKSGDVSDKKTISTSNSHNHTICGFNRIHWILPPGLLVWAGFSIGVCFAPNLGCGL